MFYVNLSLENVRIRLYNLKIKIRNEDINMVKRHLRSILNISIGVSIALVAVLSVALLSGCDGTTPAPAPKTPDPIINFAKPDKQVLTQGGNSPQIQIPTYNEVAVDALDRSLPNYDQVGGPRENKYVGVFYFLWTSDPNLHTSLDNTKLIAQNPTSPKLGGKSVYHWWAEPETGYHDAGDIWQIKRDLYYLSAAGVDFLYLDFTNQYIYADALTKLLDVSLELRAQGIMTPYFVPWTAGGDITPGPNVPGQDLVDLYKQFYKKDKYADLWFHWEGKPLVMLVPPLDVLEASGDSVLAECKDFFTFRVAWTRDVTWPGEEEGRWCWPDNDIPNYGYYYGWDEDPKKAEFAGIGLAGFADMGEGRSGEYSTAQHLDLFTESEYTGQGLTFRKTFDEVMQKNPEVEVLTISRWNEWIAMNLKRNDFGFVDQYNREFSRDIEPAKNGYTDNYYYQMCAIIREFKGVSKADVSSGETNPYAERDFSKWQSVNPVYTDFIGDTSERNYRGADHKSRYTNKTGRNDIVESRFAYDGENVYFYARAAKPLTKHTGDNWMLLFIDSDNNKKTGWEGYDYLINYSVVDISRTVVCKYEKNVWKEIGITDYNYMGAEIQIRVSRAALGLTGENIQLGFHWMDNITNVYSLYDWFTTGDSAPERRNNYFVNVSSKFTGNKDAALSQRDGAKIQYMLPADLKEENVKESSLKEGITVQYYDLPRGYTKQPELYLLNAIKANNSFVQKVSLDGFAEKSKNGCYALNFTGWIYVEKDGEYTFSLNSDDGSMLYINDRVIVDNGGSRYVQKKSGTIGLAAGYHKISLEYFEAGDGKSVLEFDSAGCKLYSVK